MVRGELRRQPEKGLSATGPRPADPRLAERQRPAEGQRAAEASRSAEPSRLQQTTPSGATADEVVQFLLRDAGEDATTRTQPPPAAVAKRANEGLASATEGFPHFDILQQAFGRFDLSGVRSATDARAAESVDSLGANAYATPSGVAFGGAPDLRTAAHEATHVIQQRHGQKPAGGVGSRGDRFERDADRVADAVAGGRAAEPLLTEMVGESSRTSDVPTPSPLAESVQFDKKSRQDAMDLEARDGGHSLDRHGPQVTSEQLRARLETGVAADSTFSPVASLDKDGSPKAGQTGLSTKFHDHEDYLKTRQSAINLVNGAIAGTKALVTPLAMKIPQAEEALKNEGDKAKKKQRADDVKAARAALENAVAGIPAGSTSLLPVRVAKGKKDPAEMVTIYGSYSVIVDHGRRIGRGYKGEDAKKVADPSGSGKEGVGFDTIKELPNVTKTRTTLNGPGGAALATIASAAAWAAAQHFPCDEPTGIFT